MSWRASNALAQGLGISVENSTAKSGTESSGIIGHAGIKIGDEIAIPGDQIRQAIQRLWALRIFSDVQVLIDNKVDNGVYLLIKVKEYPRLDHVDIEGSDDVSKDDIMKKVTVVKGQVISPDEARKIANTIKKLYEGEGHLLAVVTSSTVPADTVTGNTVVLKIKIDEGRSVTLDKVHVAGGKVFSEDDIKDQLDDTKEKTWWHFWSHPKFDKKKFEADKQKVVKFFRKNGYLDAEVVSDTTWYSPDKKKIDVLLTVHADQEEAIGLETQPRDHVRRVDARPVVLEHLPHR